MVMEATGKFHRAGPSQSPRQRVRGRRRQSPAFAAVRRGRRALWPRPTASTAECWRSWAKASSPTRVAPPSELMESLQELLRGRDAAVDARTALLNQLGATTARPGGPRDQASAPRRSRRRSPTSGHEIERLIAADPLLARRMEILTSIPGVGIATAIALIAGLTEIGSLSAKEAAMIVGLAPIACDSGQHSGRPPHQGRTRPMSDALFYMAALSAARRNPALKSLL